MAYARINNGKVFLNKLGLEINEGSYYIADSIEDIKKIQYNDITCPVGSVCLVLGYQEGNNTFEDTNFVNEGGGPGASTIYFMGSNKHWTKFTGVANIIG